jgi:phosphatase NudJ
VRDLVWPLLSGISACLIVACAPTPACRSGDSPAPKLIGNAGCLLQSGPQVLLIEHRVGGGLGLPGGTSVPGETAACTAHRETWEETGLDVQVGELLAQLENGFFVFGCKTDEPLAQALPWRSRIEVKGLRWVDPALTDPGDWRFPDQARAITALAAISAGERESR